MRLFILPGKSCRGRRITRLSLLRFSPFFHGSSWYHGSSNGCAADILHSGCTLCLLESQGYGSRNAEFPNCRTDPPNPADDLMKELPGHAVSLHGSPLPHYIQTKNPHSRSSGKERTDCGVLVSMDHTPNRIQIMI